ncbi:DUF427 domain-containing protein [Aquihabitans sp. McL0605]|uniref:DUF427 domain-containing protein n=1 Tax=Aquihabitans sp. McL0605 TaxID=3415671 RepID=UPI003CF76E43
MRGRRPTGHRFGGQAPQGVERPPRIEPGPGQESVWDYPRPPRVEATSELIRVVHGGRAVCETARALRVLETSQPPGIYIPTSDTDMSLLRPSPGHSFCEWKGAASYHHLLVPGSAPVVDACWYYPQPPPAYAALIDHVAFYPQLVDACFIEDEQVAGNEGTFYGGWITSRIVGPFKGGDGTWGW